jgi:hypothetical protein
LAGLLFCPLQSGCKRYKRDASCVEARCRLQPRGAFGAITPRWPARTGKSGRAALIGAGDRGDVSADQGAVIQGFLAYWSSQSVKRFRADPSRTRNSSPHSVGGPDGSTSARLRRLHWGKEASVIGVSPDTGPAQESNAFAQWWKRSSGDGVAMSAGIISLIAGR